VRASHDSLHGRIVSDWKHEREKLALDVAIPANTTATVFIPAKTAADVTEGGKPLDKATGVRFLRAENNCAVLAVESGVYHFVAKNAK